jgi:Coiled-coil domain-containing protein 124 /Oxs1
VTAGILKEGANADDDSDDYEKNLEVNWNHVWREQYMKDLQQYDEVIDATGIDDILKQTDSKNQSIDMHPEKRMKAAWANFVEEEMPKYRKENPSLKRSQILQIMSKEWQTHPNNPIVKAKVMGIWKPAKFQKGGKKEAEDT